MTDTENAAGATQPIAEAASQASVEQRLAALETRLADLVAELHRHVSLILPDRSAPSEPSTGT